MSNAYVAPAELLRDLGIREPKDLDIEAIAEYCGATVVYRPLEGCEARIIGYRDRAIITVNADSIRPRQRFSAAHELGHWMRDRGKVAFRCEDQSFLRQWSENNPETRANRYAAELLLPAAMFRPRTHKQPITFTTVRMLAEVFEMSLTATAIRLVELGSFPSMLVCHGPEGHIWFVSSSGVGRKLWPVDQPGSDTVAYRLLGGEAPPREPVDVRADQWVNHPRSHRYWIKEDSLRTSSGLVLSLLWWEDEQQLVDFDEYEERRFSERSDRRRDWE